MIKSDLDENTSSDGKVSVKAGSVTIIDEFNIDDIERDEKLQAREQLDQATIDSYAEEMKRGVEFPPVDVFHDGTKYYLADGWHRFKAALSIDATRIPANVRSGTRHDAVLYAAGSNSRHGLRRTRADKRKAVSLLLHDEECRGWSDRKLADQAGVDHKTVASVRKELVASGEIPQIIGQPNSSTRDGQQKSDGPTEADEGAETALQGAPFEFENTPDETPEPDQPESADPTDCDTGTDQAVSPTLESISDCIAQAVMACLQPFPEVSLSLIEEAYQQAWRDIQTRLGQQDGSTASTTGTSDC